MPATWLLTLYRALRRGTAAASRNKSRRSYRPTVEILESRVTPASLSTLLSFNPNPNGEYPNGLISDGHGDYFGTTHNGGAADEGTVFELSSVSGGYSLTTLIAFNYTNGEFPNAGLVLDGSGDLFGTTAYGGVGGDGTVFEFAPVSGGYSLTTLISFNYANGYEPNTGLLLNGSGDLFGTTYYGGVGGEGTVFELSPASGGYSLSTLISFNDTNGVNPNPGLVLDGSGDLFGTTSSIEDEAYGTVFELSPVSGSYSFSTLVSFNDTNGAYPDVGLVLNGSGDLFGTTSDASDGGIYYSGTIFELSPISGGGYSLSTLVFFNGTNGAYPEGGLVLDGSGNLFGTTYEGGTSDDGTLFELSPASGYSLSTLISFNDTNGESPDAGLVLDGSGDLFGTTYEGGTSGDGTVFELSPASGSYTLSTLVSFNETNNGGYSSLVLDGSGDLFGTTSGSEGGIYYSGTVFELSPASGSYALSTLVSFATSNGAEPDAGLVMNASGDLFGTTYYGGTSDEGTVFELSPASGGYSLSNLISFNDTNGAYPEAGLVLNGSGDLFGTTTGGGTFDEGTVFELSPVSGGYSLSTLIAFDETNGAYPDAGVILDGSGNLFGTTYDGGTSDYGTVFELSPASGGYSLSTLIAFNDTNGAGPDAGLILDGSGDLFGTTTGYYDGDSSDYGYGTVFELSPVSGGGYSLSTLIAFNDTNGAFPVAGLVLDGSGDLFGTTSGNSDGGIYFSGTVFELSPASGSYSLSTLIAFSYANGAYPDAGLVLDGNGDLFGTTYEGGVGGEGDGTVFELSPTSGNYNLSTLISFDYTDGAYPVSGVVLDGSELFGTTPSGGVGGEGTVYEVEVNAGLSITTNPSNQTVVEGQSVTFTAAAPGSPTPSVQWELSTNEGLSFAPIPGATSTSFSFTATPAENGFEFEAVFSAGPSNATTTAATLTVDLSALPILLQPNPTSTPEGLSPQEIQSAYGFSSISYEGVTGDGAGQTIAIIDAYNDPDIISDLQAYSAEFGLPQMNTTDSAEAGVPFFQVVYTNDDGVGTSTVPANSGDAGPDSGGWAAEEALDVEQVHTVAPDANIILVECADYDPDTDSLEVSAETAANGGDPLSSSVFPTLPAFADVSVSVVSMSFAQPESSGETSADSLFSATNVTFVAASGDFGGALGAAYPASSANVLSVGGTELSLNSNGSYAGESVWNDLENVDQGYDYGASTGGASEYESQPGYQSSYINPFTGQTINGLEATEAQTSGVRASPDVAYDADPDTGVSVYDSYDGSAGTPWFVMGGTDLGAASWAGFVADVDQGRVLADDTPYSTDQILPALYSLGGLASSYSNDQSAAFPDDFNNITLGNNGTYPAGAGYNLCTGLGSPNAPALAFALTGVAAAAPTVTQDPAAATGNMGASVTFTAAGTNVASIQWEVSTDGGLSFTPIVGATQGSYSFLATGAENGYEYAAGFGNDVGSVASNPGLLTVNLIPAVPEVDFDPSSVGVAIGGMAGFAAAAESNPDSTVEWLVSTNGGATFDLIVGGATITTDPSTPDTSSTLTFITTVAEDQYEFEAVFTNSNGSATSAPATLTAEFAPLVTLDPTSKTVAAGNEVTLSSAATGEPAPTVQWEVSSDGGGYFSPIPGATLADFSFSATLADNQCEYFAVFSNNQESAFTTAATLTVESAPSVAIDPVSQTVAAGNAVIFSAAASGIPVATVQWKVSSNGGASFSNVSGATSTTLTFTVSAAENGFEYEAVFSNSQGTTTTTAATLTVNNNPTAPVVSLEPSNQAVPNGSVVTFTAGVSGNPIVTVQWEDSTDGGSTFAAVSGATSTSYSFTVKAAQNQYEYEAVFSNSQGSATTTAATLTVEFTPVITMEPSSPTVGAGSMVFFTASATGEPAAAVQWQASSNTGTSFSAISGATSSMLAFTATNNENDFEYEAVFSNSQGSMTSTPDTLTVVPPIPELFVIGTNQEIYYQTFNSNGIGQSPFTQSAPGFAVALASTTDSVGPELFVIGTNQEIYFQQLNADGTPMANPVFLQSAPGFATALAVCTDSIGPELFVIGTNQEIYFQQLSANGMPLPNPSFQQSAPGFAIAIAAASDTLGPELFVIGTNQEIYSQQLNASGVPLPNPSFQQTAPGFALALSVGNDNIGPELFVIGTNQEIYSQQLNADGTPMALPSFQQTAPGFALALGDGADSIGPELFVIGTNQEIYAQQLNGNGSPLPDPNFQETAPGFALALSVTDPVVEATAQALAQTGATPADLDAYFGYDPFGVDPPFASR